LTSTTGASIFSSRCVRNAKKITHAPAQREKGKRDKGYNNAIGGHPLDKRPDIGREFGHPGAGQLSAAVGYQVSLVVSPALPY
jgi:hypothetical protein